MSDRRSRRTIKLAHASSGRTRLRLNWLHREPGEAVALADQLAEIEGVIEVRARASTGSVLCLHDPQLLGADDILAATKEVTGVATVIGRGEETREESPEETKDASVAIALQRGVDGLDRDLRLATDGRIDLGTLAAAGFLSLGAAEVLFTRKLPMPPWFNLAWWAFRTFTAFDHVAIDEVGEDA